MKRSTLLHILCLLVLLPGCTMIRMERADQAYDLMQYPKAERLYGKVLSRTEVRRARARLADSHRQHNALVDARTQYAILDAQQPLTGDTALAYGQVLMGLGEHDLAAPFFLRVLEQTPENSQALHLYESTRNYASFLSDTAHFTVKRLTLPGILTAMGSVPYRDGFLVAGEREVPITSANPWNERSFLDIYYCATTSPDLWQQATPLPGSVNGSYHEGPVALSPNGKYLYFTRSNYAQRKLLKDDRNTSHLKLFRATLDSTGKWGDMHAFPYNSEDWSTGHPALSPDGKTLYFASDRPGGFGGSDIWRCRDNGTGWNTPENLGPTVNTAGAELFPTVNGDVLHFSSTAHRNMGGLDIFATHEQNGNWTVPANLNSPINTAKDDFFFVLDSLGKAGFLSSDRDGLDQIYSFVMNDPTYHLAGVVTDENGLYLPNTEVSMVNLFSGEDNSTLTGPGGEFLFNLDPNSTYSVRAQRENHLNTTKYASTKGLTRSDTLHMDLQMKGVNFGEAIAIRNIYYDFDKWDIRPEAAVELDKLARIFIDNPNLSFELGSHTDSRGKDLYNLVLSDARANSAVDYLIRQGVDPDRITAKGYGEEVLSNDCPNGARCSEEEHQANRRTEFKVIGVAGIAAVSRP